MSTLANILGGDLISDSRVDINANFTALNNEKIETSVISTDNTLGGVSPSDSKLPTEKAINEFVLATASPVGKSWNEYAIANSGSDSYTITVPGVTALVAGQTFKFKADVANTGACTLNVNGLGAKSIKKEVSNDLLTNEILANQAVEVMYDGTYMQLQSPIATVATLNPVVNVYTSSGTWTKPAGLKYIEVEVQAAGGGGGSQGSGGYKAGGGAGGYGKKKIAAASLAATESYVVGVGGVGATSSNSYTATDGGNSSFGTFVTTTGGKAEDNGSAGGTSTGGDINISGLKGVTIGSVWSAGGASFLSCGNNLDENSNGVNYGQGGAGTSGSGQNAGSGANGVVIVTEYYG